jgi:hypothetical protein
MPMKTIFVREDWSAWPIDFVEDDQNPGDNLSGRHIAYATLAVIQKVHPTAHPTWGGYRSCRGVFRNEYRYSLPLRA